MFVKMMFAALLAVTAENLLFSGGLGFSRALRAARRPASAGVYALFVTFFSLCSALAGNWLAPRLSGSPWVLYPAALTAAAGVFYLAAAGLLRALAAGFYDRHARILAQAAANTVVLAVPFVQRMLRFSLAETVGYALGTGAAFFLAVLVLEEAMRVCSNPDMPRAFSGLPGVLVYVGILSMAFAGFFGKVF